MDREPEKLQFLGVQGIFTEAHKIVFSWKKIFSQITLALILPLSIIILSHIQVSEFLAGKIIHNEVVLQDTWSGNPTNNKISDRLWSEWTTLWLFKAAYLLFVVVLSLLSTSACVYTIACVYTAKEITFKMVMSVVPKVWKRLMITFLCNFIIMFGYTFVFILLFILLFIFWIFFVGTTAAGIVIMVIGSIIYLIGSGYISIVWYLANVVSVLEDKCGIQAMIKSKELIKGKMLVASAIFVTFQLFSSLNYIGFEKLVVHGDSFGMVNRVCFAFVCFVFLSIMILLGLVLQTIIYFVCKSYHHESIDKSCLADHLEVYLGEYVPLKNKDVQLEQVYV